METQDILFRYLKELVYHTDSAVLHTEELPEEFQKLGQAMELLGQWLGEAKQFSAALAKGELSYIETDRENVFVAPMKELQGTLRHLAWQTQQVAKGDYSQKVDFMGDFSEAFNTMTKQLEERREALISEKRRIEQKNAELERERKQKETLMYKFAYTEVLTGLYNRRYAMEKMETLVEEKRSFVLSFVDVDYLKYCNDTYGHLTGDAYLLEIAGALAGVAGTLCHIGGDEFMVIAEDASVEEQNQRLEEVRREVVKAGANSTFPKSFSYASCAVPADTKKSLGEYIRMVDTMMYTYKEKCKLPLKDAVYRDDRRLSLEGTGEETKNS